MAVLNPGGQETVEIQHVAQATQPVPLFNGNVYYWHDTTTGRKWIVAMIGGIVVKSEYT